MNRIACRRDDRARDAGNQTRSRRLNSGVFPSRTDEIHTVLEVVSFVELRWLREVSVKARATIPEIIEARLLKRGLIERTTGGVMVTARGRIALSKLG